MTRRLADYAEALRLDPKDALANFNRAILYDGKGDHDKAIADYTETIRLDPKYAGGYYGRGLAYHKKGEYDKAIADYDQAIRIDPASAVQLLNRGHSYREKHQYDKALADYTEAMRLAPRLADAYYAAALPTRKRVRRPRRMTISPRPRSWGISQSRKRKRPRPDRKLGLFIPVGSKSRLQTCGPSVPRPLSIWGLRCRNFVSSPFGADIYSDLLPPHGRQRKGNHS